MARSRRPQPARTTSRPQAPASSNSFGITRWLGVLLLVGSFAGGLWWMLRPAPAGPVILISIDTLRADHLSVYGYTKGRTPNIEALAKDSVVFDRAYAHAPQTLPSHTSILTGELPFEHGVRDNLGFTVKPGQQTMASLFRVAGYRTGAFVSAYVLRRATGLNQGFDVFDDSAPAGSQERSVSQVQRAGPDTLAAAQQWLGSLSEPKFFLFFHLYEPHAPYTPPQRYADLAPYDGEIAYSDEILGELVATLRSRGWYDTATIVVLSDHGEDLNEHGEEEHGLFLYNSTMHVPMIIKLPGQKNSGRHISAPVQHIDLLPTLASLSRIGAPSLRGRDLSAALRTGKAIAPQGIYAEALYAHYHFGWSELLSLTDERYRFIEAPKSELYDLDRDFNETTNLLGERPQVAQAMRTGLDGLVAGRGLDAPSAVSAEDRERLAALGYIGSATSLSSGNRSNAPDPKDKREILRLYRKAVNALGEGRLVEGVTGLRAILATEPNMADVWNQLGTVLAKLGRTEEALQAFREVIRLQPNEPIALVDAAQMLMKLGRYAEARGHAELAMKAQPVPAHDILAKIALAEKDPSRALREAELAQQAEPEYPLPDFIRGVIAHEAGDYSGALPHFMQAYRQVKDRTMQINDLRYYIADCLARLERSQEAEQFFKEEIALYPNNTRARLGLAMLYEASGQSDATEAALQTLLNTVPTPDSYEQVAKLWRLFGQPQRAAAVMAQKHARFGR